MALSEANQLTVCQILSIVPSALTYQLTMLSTSFTSTAQAAVEAQIALWEAGANVDYTYIEPNVKNFGARISPESARAAIRKNIAVLLERPDWANSGSFLQRS